MLTWYYANALTRQSRARQRAQTQSTNRAQGEMPLPSLGRIDPPPPDLPSSPAPITPTALPEIPLEVSTAGGAAGTTGAPACLNRRLPSSWQWSVNCPVWCIRRRAQFHGAVAGVGELPPPSSGSQEPGELAALLRPSLSAAVRAQLLPTQRLLLPKGAFIDCTLETAIDSTLPGMTTCVMATDAFGVDGQVVLMERGTKLIGETARPGAAGIRASIRPLGGSANACRRDRAAGFAGCGRTGPVGPSGHGRQSFLASASARLCWSP